MFVRRKQTELWMALGMEPSKETKNVTIYEALKMILEAYGVNFEEGLGGQNGMKIRQLRLPKSLNFGLPLKARLRNNKIDMARLIWRQEGIQWREADQSLSEDARCSGAIPGYCPFWHSAMLLLLLSFLKTHLFMFHFFDPLYSVKEEEFYFSGESDTVRRLGWLNENPNITVFQNNQKKLPKRPIWRNIFSSSELSRNEKREMSD